MATTTTPTASVPRAHPTLLEPTHVFMNGQISPLSDDVKRDLNALRCVVPQHWERAVFYRQVYVYTPPTPPSVADAADDAVTSCACESNCACECLLGCTCECTTCDAGTKVDTPARRREREVALDATLASIELPRTVLCGFCSLDCIHAFELDAGMLIYCHSAPEAWRVAGDDDDDDDAGNAVL